MKHPVFPSQALKARRGHGIVVLALVRRPRGHALSMLIDDCLTAHMHIISTENYDPRAGYIGRLPRRSVNDCHF